jgi:hypothetical protein
VPFAGSYKDFSHEEKLKYNEPTQERKKKQEIKTNQERRKKRIKLKKNKNKQKNKQKPKTTCLNVFENGSEPSFFSGKAK